jgi:2-polyprenyl-3-methyl-5-hydroxy-6-metoxy-1,4-benzoquinol methylase
VIFKVGDKEYPVDKRIRDEIVPTWREMMNPAKSRKLLANIYGAVDHVTKTEKELHKHGISLVGKNILEIGCAYGERSYLMAKYEGTAVKGIDVNNYIVEQSPDLNIWNPEDIVFVDKQLLEIRSKLASTVPDVVAKKVSFDTASIESYFADSPVDMIVSWDVLEHIMDLDKAFENMSVALKTGGIAYHEYNPFFAINGGHSLCTLDFLYGHCLLSSEEFERYIREIRPEEEKIDLNFYHKCLNRATRSDIKDLAIKHGFDILEFAGNTTYPPEQLKNSIVDAVKVNYPNVTRDDLLSDSVHIILRKK